MARLRPIEADPIEELSLDDREFCDRMHTITAEGAVNERVAAGLLMETTVRIHARALQQL